MGPAAGTRQRIIARNRYIPTELQELIAHRKVRVDEPSGATSTFKKKGDFVIDSCGRAHEVTHDGF